MILVYGEGKELKRAISSLKEQHGKHVYGRTSRKFFGVELCDKVYIVGKPKNIVQRYEEAGIEVEVLTPPEQPRYTQEEVRKMKFLKKKSVIKEIFGVNIENAIGAEHFIEQLPHGPRTTEAPVLPKQAPAKKERVSKSEEKVKVDGKPVGQGDQRSAAPEIEDGVRGDSSLLEANQVPE